MISFLLGWYNAPFLQGFAESWVISIKQSFNFYCRSHKFTTGPINVRVEGAEPRVSEDHSIRSKVSNVEVFTVLFCSVGYKEVKVVCNLSGLVKGSIDVS